MSHPLGVLCKCTKNCSFCGHFVNKSVNNAHFDDFIDSLSCFRTVFRQSGFQPLPRPKHQPQIKPPKFVPLQGFISIQAVFACINAALISRVDLFEMFTCCAYDQNICRHPVYFQYCTGAVKAFVFGTGFLIFFNDDNECRAVQSEIRDLDISA